MARKVRAPSSPRRHFSAGVRLIEEAISPGGSPVIGLHLYMACIWLVRSMVRGSRFAVITPASIGVPALVKAHPGMSQTELADLMGIERMTAGVHVARCVRAGLIRRKRSTEDQRKYRLYTTPKGVANLRRVASLIPQHEQHLFGGLSTEERATLYRLLSKLIESADKEG